MRHVLVSVKLGNGWNEWQHIGGFSFDVPSWYTAEEVARHARFIVDRHYDDTVQVQVYNVETKLYDQEFTFHKIQI